MFKFKKQHDKEIEEAEADRLNPDLSLYSSGWKNLHFWLITKFIILLKLAKKKEILNKQIYL